MIEETEADLRRLNEQIPAEENRANRLFFEERLAWVFAMRRAPGMLDSRKMFLLSLKPDGNRTCDPESIKITRFGKHRAFVNCLVKVNNETFHNMRLFILDGDGEPLDSGRHVGELMKFRTCQRPPAVEFLDRQSFLLLFSLHELTYDNIFYHK